MRRAFDPFYVARRPHCQWVPKKPYTQSKGHEQSKVKYGQDHPAKHIADELADPFPSLPYFS
jgi:hypothetical protein